MGPTEVKVVAMSITVIGGISWWDFFHHRGQINFLMGVAGIVTFAAFVWWVWSDRNRVPDDEIDEQ